MDGIFGVGVAEVIVIGLVLFIIGGPENTAKWARELGRWVRKAREAWSDVMTQLEDELGDEGKELVDAAREVGQEVRGLRSMNPTRGAIARALEADLKITESKTSESTAKPSQQDSPASSTETAVADSDDARYAAWRPPDSPQN